MARFCAVKRAQCLDGVPVVLKELERMGVVVMDRVCPRTYSSAQFTRGNISRRMYRLVKSIFGVCVHGPQSKGSVEGIERHFVTIFVRFSFESLKILFKN